MESVWQMVPLSAGIGLVGLVVPDVTLRLLSRLQMPGGIFLAGLSEGLPPRVLVAGGTLLLAATGLLGLASVWPAWRRTPTANLTGRADAGPRRRLGLQGPLLQTQVALSLVLVITAGLLVRTVRAANAVELGFDPTRLLVAALEPELGGYSEAAMAASLPAIVEEARRLPAVQSVSYASSYLEAGAASPSVYRDGAEQTPPAAGFLLNRVGPDYLETVGLGLVGGRSLTSGDAPGARLVGLVNEAMARALWPGSAAVGKRLEFGYRKRTEVEIVGVVRNAKYLHIDEDQKWCLYVPLAQYPSRLTNPVGLLVRTGGTPSATAPALRKAIGRVAPDMPISALVPMGELARAPFAHLRFVLGAAGSLGSLTMGLAGVGLFTLVALDVSRRTREIAIRQAVGASPRVIVWEVMRRGIAVGTVGVGFGVIAAYLVSSTLSALLFGVQATDMATYGLAVLMVLATVVVACLVPARRAGSVDLVTALRCDG